MVAAAAAAGGVVVAAAAVAAAVVDDVEVLMSLLWDALVEPMMGSPWPAYGTHTTCGLTCHTGGNGMLLGTEVQCSLFLLPQHSLQ